jgi:putative glutamine amidotransferase
MKVGVTTGRWRERAHPYAEAAEAVGLEPCVLSSADYVRDETTVAQVEAIARHCLAGLDGLLMSGGGDVDPALLGIEYHHTIDFVDDARDRFERALFLEAWRSRLPVFGICRGMQVMNWALGGTLIPDIDCFVEPRGHAKGHRAEHPDEPRHVIRHQMTITPGSELSRILGAGPVGVNSIHHQALDRLAPEFVVSGIAPEDGVIEAVEVPQRPVFAVQFHPEEMWRHHPHMLELFRHFARLVSAQPAR